MEYLIDLNKLFVMVGFASSITDAHRKIVNKEVGIKQQGEFLILNHGKRKWLKIDLNSLAD
jgi:hypothetical protein